MSSLVANAIHEGFKAYRHDFQDVTRTAGDRFEEERWLDVQEAHSQRLAMYKEHVNRVAQAICNLPDYDSSDSRIWEESREDYRNRLASEYNAELFETFYNSVHRHLTNDGDVTNREMFVHTCYPSPPAAQTSGLTRTYTTQNGVVEMMHEIVADLPFTRPWRHIEKDVGSVLRSLVEYRPQITDSAGLKVELLRPVFYRNKGAYVVGQISFRNEEWPIAFPVLINDGQLHIDSLVCDEDELSVLFSFTRAYFMVLTEHPYALVDFLQHLLPNKKRSELYASIGLHKHAKTVFYRNFLEHLAGSTDHFVISAGIKGMVMTVFTLASYKIVFKIIKDEFAPQKKITAKEVREKYHIVKHHDRVGRMADTQEFQNLVLPRSRFDSGLLEELRRVASSSVRITRDRVFIHHLYTERLMIPLNLFIERSNRAEIKEALDEYGNAIKQLAAANIFPGDMLLKNFGVTRHGRVVFYDYDEIRYLTDMNFRAIPEARTIEEEMAAEPWYSVGADDVFPEEFRRFLFGKPEIKQLFDKLHGELFDPAYWRQLQHTISNGQVVDVFPYRRKRRFIHNQ